MKIKAIKIFLLALLLVVLSLGFVPRAGLAVTNSGVTDQARCDAFKEQFTVNGQNPFAWMGNEYCTAPAILVKAIQLGLTFAGTVAVIFIIYGGYLFMVSAGNEEAAEKGKKVLTNSIIGLTIILMSYVIVTVVSNTITGNLGSTSSSSKNGSQTNGSNFSSANQTAQAAVAGDFITSIGNDYNFTVTTNKAMTDSICGGNSPSVYAIVYHNYTTITDPNQTESANQWKKIINSFGDDGTGNYTASFSVNPSSLGFSDAELAANPSKTMTIEAYICGQLKASKSVTLSVSTK